MAGVAACAVAYAACWMFALLFAWMLRDDCDRSSRRSVRLTIVVMVAGAALYGALLAASVYQLGDDNVPAKRTTAAAACVCR